MARASTSVKAKPRKRTATAKATPKKVIKQKVAKSPIQKKSIDKRIASLEKGKLLNLSARTGCN